MRHLLWILLALTAAAAPQPDEPSAADRDRVLNIVREFAGDYIQRLPNFVCLRTTQHLVRNSPAAEWKAQVKVANELTYYGRQEHYRVVAVNDAPANKIPRLQNWVYSAGDFGGVLSQLLGPKSPATFDWKGWEPVRGKRAFTFTYRMPGGYLVATCESCKTHEYPYHGAIYISADTLTIVRLTVIPDHVPQIQDSRTIEYDHVNIAGAEYLLPVADTFERTRGKWYFRNESVYRDYRKFTADSAIQVGPGQEP